MILKRKFVAREWSYWKECTVTQQAAVTCAFITETHTVVVEENCMFVPRESRGVVTRKSTMR